MINLKILMNLLYIFPGILYFHKVYISIIKIFLSQISIQKISFCHKRVLKFFNLERQFFKKNFSDESLQLQKYQLFDRFYCFNIKYFPSLAGFT